MTSIHEVKAPRNFDEAKQRLRDAERTVKQCRHRGVNPVPHEKYAQQLRQRWMIA